MADTTNEQTTDTLAIDEAAAEQTPNQTNEQAEDQPGSEASNPELEKELTRREELVEKAEQVAEARDWSHGSGDLRRLRDEWNALRRWHDPREDALWKRFKTASDAFYQARDAERAKVKEAKERLVAEAEQLAQSSQWNATAERLRAMMDEWKAAGRTGNRSVDDGLWERFNAARETFYQRRSEHFAELDAKRDEARQTKERLVEEAKAAAVTASDWTGAQWRAASAKMKELMDQWKAAGVAPKADNDRLWEEFQAARQPFFDAQHAYYEGLETARKAAAEAKEKLVAEAKALAESNDFGREATERAKQLDRDWKELGYAGREANDRLWEAFRAAKEAFWDKKRAANETRHQEWVQRTQEAIDRRKTRVANLQQQVARLQERLNNAYATDHVEEMQAQLDEKKQVIEDIETEIHDMEQRLGE